MVGQWTDDSGNDHGFLLLHNVYISVDVPGSTSTDPYAINDVGAMVGGYTDANGVDHGFAALVLTATNDH